LPIPPKPIEMIDAFVGNFRAGTKELITKVGPESATPIELLEDGATEQGHERQARTEAEREGEGERIFEYEARNELGMFCGEREGDSASHAVSDDMSTTDTEGSDEVGH